MDAMNAHELLYPMFAMVVLTFGVLVTLFRTRARFVREGSVQRAFFSTYQEGSEPEASAKLARHFVNLFEAPTLFYVACLAAMITGQSTPIVIGLAWLYVLARAVHTIIHTGSNRLDHRIAAYFTSWVALLGMWVGILVGAAS